MPSLTLPAQDALGNGTILTPDYQVGINELLDYVRAINTELTALSSSTLAEGAVSIFATEQEHIDATATNKIANPAGVKAYIASLGNMAERNIFISTATPSGGADGDVWCLYG